MLQSASYHIRSVSKNPAQRGSLVMRRAFPLRPTRRIGVFYCYEARGRSALCVQVQDGPFGADRVPTRAEPSSLLS